MAKPTATYPQNHINIDITSDNEGNQYIRQTMRPVAPMTFFGRLGGEIELAEVGRDNRVRGVFSLATDWQDYGVDGRTTGWVRVTVWGRAAEVLAANVTKGDQLIVTAESITTLIGCDTSGRVRVNDNNEPRISTEITLDGFQLVSNGGRSGGGRRGGSTLSYGDNTDLPPANTQDEIPF